MVMVVQGITESSNRKREALHLPRRSALRLSKHSDPDERSSVKGVSRVETGLG